VQEEHARKYPEVLPRIEVSSHALPIMPPVVPLQTNSCDCGVFVLAFAERFLKDRERSPLLSTWNQIKKKCSKQFGTRWFLLNSIPNKRKELAGFVVNNGHVQ
jgi:Ulp1 family protease